ncbi:MAG TPA: response regulator [Myxococcota bacterium]|jgi:two-component system chemotaxis response regulator CheY
MAKKILVVDDSATVRLQVRGALLRAGYEVLEAVDGVDAYAQLQASTDIAAVVCDVNMPRMDGIELLEKVKAGPPTLMLTTEGEPALVARAKLAGAKGWLVKPFKSDVLVAALGRLA